MKFEKKDTAVGDVTILDVDDTSRRVKVAISRMGNLDLDNDVVDKTAFNRTIKERGPKGANLIWHLTDHTPSLKSAVGKFSDLYKEGDYLVGVTDIPSTAWGNDMLEFYKTGHINQHSIGFRTVKSEPVGAGKPGEYRLITEIMLYEGSAVLWGANPETPTVSVGKSLTIEEKKELYFETLKEVNNLAKLFKTGHLTDETFELVEIKLVQTTDKLQQLYTEAIQPAQKAFDPADKSLLDVLTTFNNQLILQHGSQRITGSA